MTIAVFQSNAGSVRIALLTPKQAEPLRCRWIVRGRKRSWNSLRQSKPPQPQYRPPFHPFDAHAHGSAVHKYIRAQVHTIIHTHSHAHMHIHTCKRSRNTSRSTRTMRTMCAAATDSDTHTHTRSHAHMCLANRHTVAHRPRARRKVTQMMTIAMSWRVRRVGVGVGVVHIRTCMHKDIHA